MNISIREPTSYLDVKFLTDFLFNHNLDYPNYEQWVLRCKTEIEIGYKKAIIAWEENKIAGCAIFQSHKELPNIREIKNLRIDSKYKNRRFGSFLLRQVEYFERESYSYLIADFRENLLEVERLLLSEDYSIVATRNLYDQKFDKIALKKNRYSKESEICPFV